jgi:hypothetical protein
MKHYTHTLVVLLMGGISSSGLAQSSDCVPGGTAMPPLTGRPDRCCSGDAERQTINGTKLWVCKGGARPSPSPVATVGTHKVTYRPGCQWFRTGIRLDNGQTAVIRWKSGAVSVLGSNNPAGPEGVGGRPPAGPGSFLVGAPPGCLVVRDGSGQARCFTSKELTVTVPGEILLVANDEQYISRDRQGCRDNVGSWELAIEVK